jgi:hypothetical protein
MSLRKKNDHLQFYFPIKQLTMKSVSNRDLTICVLAKEKNQILEQLINHWLDKSAKLIVLHETINPLTIKSKDSSVTYLPTREPFFQRLTLLASIVDTKYVLISPDDELFTTSFINMGVEFLDINEDYSAIGGQASALWKHSGRNNFGLIYKNNLNYQTHRDLPLERAFESIDKSSGAQHIGAPYRIMRKQVFKNWVDALNNLQPIKCAYLYEVLAEVYQTIHGKVRVDNSLFWIRNWISTSPNEFNKNYYYHQWWEDHSEIQKKKILVETIQSQYRDLEIGQINQLLEVFYLSRKITELFEINRLQKLKSSPKRIIRNLRIVSLLGHLRFYQTHRSIKDLELELLDQKVQFSPAEMSEVFNLIISFADT